MDTLERFGRFEELGAVRDMLRNRYGVLILTADTGFADPTTAQGRHLAFWSRFVRRRTPASRRITSCAASAMRLSVAGGPEARRRSGTD